METKGISDIKYCRTGDTASVEYSYLHQEVRLAPGKPLSLVSVDVPSRRYLALRRVESGAVEVDIPSPIVAPQDIALSFVQYLTVEMQDFFRGTLDNWGFSEYKAPSDAEIERGASILALHEGCQLEQTLHLSCQLLQAQCPIGGSLFDDRVDDGSMTMGDYGQVGVAEYWRATNLRDFLVQGFGFYRKDLAKLALASDARLVDWLSSFSSYLTEDQIVRAFRHFEEHGYRVFTHIGADQIKFLCEFFKHPTSRYNLAIGKFFDFEMVYDFVATLEFIRKFEGKYSYAGKVNGWEQAHDVLLTSSIQEEENLLDDIPERIADIENSEHQGFRVRILKTTSDYLTTGKVLKLCIGQASFMHSAQSGLSYHLRFENSGQFYAALELKRTTNTNSPWYIKEFKAYNNVDVDSGIIEPEKLKEWLCGYFMMDYATGKVTS